MLSKLLRDYNTYYYKMDNMASSVIICSLISYYLPIEDNALKVQIGILGSQALSSILTKSNF